MVTLGLSKFLILILVVSSLAQDYYELLGVTKSANDKEIRKAFKKLAVKMHPDKNKGDPDAHANFVKLTKAYEVLKDQESRKKYDLFGEDGVKTTGQQTYHSWSYYRDNFGIYDDDPQIITLNSADFEESVLGSDALWFINFYSPMCSHCHTLAPVWRRLAQELEGVVRFGAVNCEEEWVLCRQEQIHSYPSLFLYPMRERYVGDREMPQLKEFILKRLQVEIIKIDGDTWKILSNPDDQYQGIPWVLFLLDGTSDIEQEEVRLIVAAMLEGLALVGEVNCVVSHALCQEVSGGRTHPIGLIIFWKNKDSLYPLDTVTSAKDITEQVLSFLPHATEFDAETFEDMRTQLRLDPEAPFWLVHFYAGVEDVKQSLDLKRLPALVGDIKLGRFHCGRAVDACRALPVSRYPLFALFKPGGGHEVHHGRETAYDIATFARHSRAAPYMRSITPEEFLQQTQEGGSFFVDFFAPWCPPCLRLLPELRKASGTLGGSVTFATLDCSQHAAFCRQQSVRSYPTTVLYNHTGTHPHFFHGRTASDLVDFIRDVLHPVVVELTEKNFESTVASKPVDHMWLVDYFAPWCGPCQQLSPQWRKLAKLLSDQRNIHIGEVNCEREPSLCVQQGVRTYPTIRLYPFGSVGLATFAMYSGYHRDARSLRQWVYNFLPSSVESLTPGLFEARVLRDTGEMWLVDFYAPWCGHCVSFSPEFQLVAQKLEGRVRCAKVDCEKYRNLCVQQQVNAYPTVIFYPGRREISSQSAEQIIRRVEEFIADLQRDDKYNRHDEF
ncbi:dnaJ homolog subfamily C member 10-like [Schistocerca cancellata]|uniref:dnaJ homolog subfamily C member 10-like n=1 Tax=Schistocerca cancellata TaxID=274614 RepID=UPI002117F8A0|nr:dnaJ homolog subfamily C member 10-like [Schistocerca cancellata]